MKPPEICVWCWFIQGSRQGTGYSLCYYRWLQRGFPDGSVVKNLSANGDTGDEGLIPGSGRCPGEGDGNPLQYSCLGNPMERGAWRARVHMLAKELAMPKWLSRHSLSQRECFSGSFREEEPLWVYRTENFQMFNLDLEKAEKKGSNC